MAGKSRLGSATALSCCLLFLLGAASARAAEDPAAPWFRPYAVDVIDLRLPQASFKTLEDEPEENYVEGTFSLAESDGTPGGVGPFTTPQMVGIRLKGGDGSFRPLKDGKAAFKIKFNFENSKGEKGQKFLGLKKLTLNNMVQDASMLHETMAYEAFRALAVPAPRTGYASVYVNGVNYGVHLDVETYDDVSLPHHFATTQHLYEADAPGVDVRTGEQDTFEVDEGDPPPTDLEALIGAANGSGPDWSDGMTGFVDLDEMTRMWAVERYVGHWDGYAGVPTAEDPPSRPNNYYLHSEDSGLFSMLPWGTDQTWEDDVEFDLPAGGLLFNACRGDTSCGALYVDALRETQGAVAGLDLGAQAGCLAELLAPWQAMEDGGRREYGENEIAQGVDRAREFVAARPGELSDWLTSQAGEGEGSAAGPPAPCVLPEPHGEDVRGSGSFPSGAGSASGGAGTQPQLAPRWRLALRGIEAGRRRLGAEVRIGGPGELTLVARIATAKGAHQVCDRELRVDRAGKLSLSCSLSGLARRRLRDRDLRLRVVVAFVPDGGRREAIARGVSVHAPGGVERRNRSD